VHKILNNHGATLSWEAWTSENRAWMKGKVGKGGGSAGAGAPTPIIQFVGHVGPRRMPKNGAVRPKETRNRPGRGKAEYSDTHKKAGKTRWD